MNLSVNFDKNSLYDPYNVDSPVSCTILRIMGIYLVILFISSVVFNLLHIWVFYKIDKLFTPVNSFVTTLICLNLLATILQLPLVIYSGFNCKFSFGKIGCLSKGFIMYFTGCMNIYLLTAISIERYYMTKRQLKYRTLSVKQILCAIGLCAGLSAFWAILPLVGWSHYSLEGAKISCSVEWYSHTPNVISYNLALFTFVFFVPLIIIIMTNVKTVQNLRAVNSKFKTSNFSDKQTQTRFLKQKNITRLTVYLIVFFMMSWTPYALVSMYAAFINEHNIPPLLATIPALFAKSSLVWPAFLNVILNKNISKHFKDRKKNNNNNRISSI